MEIRTANLVQISTRMSTDYKVYYLCYGSGGLREVAFFFFFFFFFLIHDSRAGYTYGEVMGLA